ncbi:MAG: hypothetical protein KAV87_19110 [Desulfobacteraceae bacterium]|nr:hypothetical protein [Desulfobacteraceae bacterium]
MAQEKTTAQKKNAYSIRCRVSQAIFEEFIVSQGDDILKGTVVGRFDRPLLSALAGIATRAIMNEPRLDVVLRKR